MFISDEEKSLILFPVVPFTGICKYEEFLVTGKFEEIIKSFIREFFHQEENFLDNVCNAASFSQYLISSIEGLIVDACNESNFSRFDVLVFGVACLYYFIQNNFLGPFESSNDDNLLVYFLKENKSADILSEIRKNIIDYLSGDVELTSSNVKQPLLLLMSTAIFSSSDFKSNKWWLMRSLYIRQLVIQDLSPSIHKQLTETIEVLENIVSSVDDDELLVMYYSERIQIHLQLFSEISKVHLLMHIVRSRLWLEEVNLHGRLGKRTRYQQCDIAQLTLQVDVGPGKIINSVESVSNESERASFAAPVFSYLDYRCSSFPKDQRLDDEIRLPETQFSDKPDKEYPALNAIQQAIILSLFVLQKKSEPNDKLLTEELTAYITFLLADPKVWNIQSATLRFRSLIEAESSRTVERSISQIQSLITDFETTSPSLLERLPFVFCSFVVPKWDLEISLAKLLVKVGAVQSALDIYNNLQMWEEIVACYNHLKLRHKAAEVIRAELTKKETVLLWCLLGDATDDLSCYQKAWEMSGCRSSRAQKHWALFLFNRKQYEESIPHFQKSLEINSLQVSLWFSFGYAALVQEHWEMSAAAYRRYTSLEPDSFEAWNNLAKSYIRLGLKDRAWRALQEAVKCNYDNWKVWDNLMAVSIDCGDFHEAIRSYHRILDIKGKHVDIELLRILVNGIKNNLVHCDMTTLKKEALKLMGRLTSLILHEPELWSLYAVLLENNNTNTLSDEERIAQYLQKAQRLASQDPGWEKTVEQCRNMINLSLHLSAAHKKCSSLAPVQQAVQHLNSAKLVLRGIGSKIKKVHTDVLGRLNENLCSDVQNMDEELSEIERLLAMYAAKSV